MKVFPVREEKQADYDVVQVDLLFRFSLVQSFVLVDFEKIQQ